MATASRASRASARASHANGARRRSGARESVWGSPRGEAPRRTTPPSWRSSKPPGPSSSARPTATSSRWDRRPRTPHSARAESVGDRSHSGRIERRIGGCRRRRDGAAGARIGHRRIDPAAGGAVRRRRLEADLRPRLALRAAGIRVVARSDRAADAHVGDAALALSVIAGADRPMRPARPSRCLTTRAR